MPWRPRQEPVRPYTAARAAVARSRASTRTTSAGIPVRASVASGRMSRDQRAQRIGAARLRGDGAWSSSPSAKITCSIDSSIQASASGRIATCSNARAVSERRGSTTTTRPPRATIACSSSLIRGAVSTLPWETSGLAPTISRRSVRARSGIGTTQRRAVEQRAGHEAVVDVLRSGAVEVVRADRVHEALDPDRMRVRERRGVAEVPAHAAAAVALEHRPQARARCRRGPRPSRPARSFRRAAAAAGG